MTADKTYLAVPAMTAFTLVRNSLQAGREYQNQLGQTMQRIETEGRRVEAVLTMYQPVMKVINGTPTIVRYTDLGDDTFNFPEKAPTLQSEAGGPPVTTMDKILDADLIASLRDVLVEIMTGAIPDFAEQPVEMAAVGVPRYFHIDRIRFSGREDRAREATLQVLLGVYEDPDCTVLKKYIQQDFVSAAVIADMQKQLSDLQARVASINAELAAPSTTDERKAALTNERSQHAGNIDKIQSQLDDVQPIAVVLSKSAIKNTLKEITEAVLESAVENRPAYKDIDVDALISRFDAAYASLSAAVGA